MRKRRPKAVIVEGALEEARKKLAKNTALFNVGLQALDAELDLNAKSWGISELDVLNRIRDQITKELSERLEIPATKAEVQRLEEAELPGYEGVTRAAKWTSGLLIAGALGLVLWLTYCARKSELTAVKEQDTQRYFRDLKAKTKHNPMLAENIAIFEQRQRNDIGIMEVVRGEVADPKVIDKWRRHSILWMNHIDQGWWTPEQTAVYASIAQKQISYVLGTHVEEIRAKITKGGFQQVLDSWTPALIAGDPSLVAAAALAMATQPAAEQAEFKKYLQKNGLTSFGDSFDVVTKWMGPGFNADNFVIGRSRYATDAHWEITVRSVWRAFFPSMRSAEVSAEVAETALRIADKEGPWALAKDVATEGMRRIKSVAQSVEGLAEKAGLFGVSWEGFKDPAHWFETAASGGLPQAYQLVALATGAAIAFWGVTQLFVHIIYGIIFFLFAKTPQQLQWYREWGYNAGKILATMGVAFIQATLGVLQIRAAAFLGVGWIILFVVFAAKFIIGKLLSSAWDAGSKAVSGLWSITGGQITALYQKLRNGKTVPVNPILHLRLHVFGAVFPGDAKYTPVDTDTGVMRKASKGHGAAVAQELGLRRRIPTNDSSSSDGDTEMEEDPKPVRGAGESMTQFLSRYKPWRQRNPNAE